jgi:O-antigen/teichoic acid export membrane protein
MTEDHKTSFIRAFKWNSASQYVNQFLILIVNIVLVRILSPADFGMVAIPVIIFNLLRTLQDIGYVDMVIRAEDKDKKFQTTVFWLIQLIGFFFISILFIFSFFNQIIEPLIINYLILSLIPGSLVIGFDMIYRKSLNFRSIFFGEFWSNFISGLIGIYCALQGYGWESLLVRLFLQYLIQSILYFFLAEFRPKFYFYYDKLKADAGFARINIMDQSLGFVSKNIDTILVSKFFNLSSLGVYDRAFKLIHLPINQVGGSFSKVLLPTISSQAINQPERLKSVGQQMLISLTVLLPLAILLLFNSEYLVKCILGNQWVEMIPLMQLFAIGGLLNHIVGTFPNYFLLADDKELFMYSSLVTKLSLIALICIAAFFFNDLRIIASTFILSPILSLLLLSNKIKIRLNSFKFSLPIDLIVASLALSIFYWISDLILKDECGFLSIIFIFLGLLIYLLVLNVMQSKSLLFLKSLIKK